MWTVTNDEIAKKLEEFGLPVEYGSVSDETLDSYNFFYYREEELEGSGKILTQNIAIYYVSVNQEDLKEPEIIRAMKSIKLNFNRAVYDRLQVERTNTFIDVVTFIFSRKLKVDC